MKKESSFWTVSAADWMGRLGTTASGLSRNEAASRLLAQGRAKAGRPRWVRDILLLLSQYKSPLILLLVIAVTLSTLLKEYSNSIIIFLVLLLTGLMGFLQERNAGMAIEKLKSLVRARVSVMREGAEEQVPVEEVVPGDILLLKAGDILAADALLLESTDLHVNEAVLTGESFPAEKEAGSRSPETVSGATAALFKGTSIVSGTGKALAIRIGEETETGRIMRSMSRQKPPTSFEKGIRRFGLLLMRWTVFMTGVILVANLLLHRPPVVSVLFALALAVGITPELLPAIVTVTLSAGAKRMAGKRVIVKKLDAIQNLGEITILCSDKTGTITTGEVSVREITDWKGKQNVRAALYAFLNARFETGLSNPTDIALRQMPEMDAGTYQKKDEVPYDFIRKRLSVVVMEGEKAVMITKGALTNITDICHTAEDASGLLHPMNVVLSEIEERYRQLGGQGYRVLGLCSKEVTGDPVITKDDETAMTFMGFIVLEDPLKPGIWESILGLERTGIELKIITGDNRFVAQRMAATIGLPATSLLTGEDLMQISDEALPAAVKPVGVFAEILPGQKARIIGALQRSGETVGYLGDGINDVNALQAADVGISIQNAVEVAREAADLVLLDRTIDAVKDGVREGRKTFANTIKYIQVTTSANFGNMISMAIASLFLPFLPLLPMQILLNNFLSDLPAMAIASDTVDAEVLERPRRWDLPFIRRFMIVFGIQSSLFDFITFGVLIFLFHASPVEFRTAWFSESLLTEILILLVIRTRYSVFRSKPSRKLLLAALVTFAGSLLIPYLPFAGRLGMQPMAVELFLFILLIVFSYASLAEWTKKRMFKGYPAGS